MATSDDKTPAAGADETQSTPGADITPSRRSSRKKQSTFSSDFEYYTPTGRKLEVEEKSTPQSVPKGKQKKGGLKQQSDGEEAEEEEEEEVSAVKKKTQKGDEKKQKGKVEEEEEEEESEEEEEVEKPKVGKGKPKVAVKKKVQKATVNITQKKKKALPQKKTKAKDESEGENDSSESEEGEDEADSKTQAGKKRKLAALAKKKTQSPQKKVKVQGGRKQKTTREESEGEEEASSSDEDDSKPISQLQAQLKKQQKDMRVSPLAQNLAKKLAKADGDSSDDESVALSQLAGQKRKLIGGEETSPAKLSVKASQFEKLGSTLASLVKRLPPADLGLVRRTPSEIAARTNKAISLNGTANTIKEEPQPPPAAVVKSETASVVTHKAAAAPKEETVKEKVKKEEPSGVVKFEEKGNKAKQVEHTKQLDTLTTKEEKISTEGQKKLPDKPIPAHKLTESELRQRKIEQIKAKIAEKSGTQKVFVDKKAISKKASSGSAKLPESKSGLKKEDAHKKKLDKGPESSERNFSNLPPHLLKKLKGQRRRLEKSRGKSKEDVIKRGVVHKKSHQPFGNKNTVIKRFADKRLSTENTEQLDDESKKDGTEDRVKKGDHEKGKGRKPSGNKRRLSNEPLKKEGQKGERRKSGGDESKTAEKKKRKSVGDDSQDQKKSDDEPPLLSPADATPIKSSKHKSHKVEHEVPLDMSMNDLFKPDGLIVHEGTTAPSGDASQDVPKQDQSTSSSGRTLSEDAQHVLLEHQYSKPSSPVGGAVGRKDSDVESVSHHRSVMIDASLPEQFLEDSVEEQSTSPTQDSTSNGEGNGCEVLEKSDMAAVVEDRKCILESLDTELKESGSDFIIVGQVEVERLNKADVSSEKGKDSAELKNRRESGEANKRRDSGDLKRRDSEDTKKRRDSGEKKKGRDSVEVKKKKETDGHKRRRDSDKSTGSRKASTESKDGKKKDKTQKKDSKQTKSSGK